MNKTFYFLAAFFLLIANEAKALDMVLDTSNLSTAKETLSGIKEQIQYAKEEVEKLTEQVNILDDVKELNDEMTKTLGEVGSWKLPITSLNEIKSQLKEDAACLIPGKPNYGIDFDKIETSLCGRAKAYSKAFFYEEGFHNMPWSEREEVRKKQQGYAINWINDTVSRSIAFSDVTKDLIDDTDKTADELQAALDGSKDLNQRAVVQGQISIAQLRATAKQIQLLNQILKVNTALALRFAVDPAKMPSPNQGEGE